MKKGLHFWLIPVLWIAVIFSLSSIPGRYIPKIPFIHPVAHMVEYAGLGILVIMWLTHSRPRAYPFQLSLCILLLVASVATLDEWYQTSIPGRNGQFLMIFWDTVYAAIGITAWDFLTKGQRLSMRRPVPVDAE